MAIANIALVFESTHFIRLSGNKHAAPFGAWTPVAQLAEQRIPNPQVECSSHSRRVFGSRREARRNETKNNMSVGIYKQGQGYWVRLMSAIGFGLLVMMGVVWLWDQLSGVQIGDVEPVYIQGGIAVITVAICGLIGYHLIGRKPKLVEFMIATEGEMRKVNWSTRREVAGSTILVILLTLFIALFCQVADLGFSAFFQWAGVLDTA